MANRIKDIAVTATTAANDDYLVVDGTTNGTRKILAGNALSAVTSVAGRTGAVTLSTADISGLGTIATQAADSVSITGGVISGLTSLGIASGTITASSPALNVTQTWNNAGVTFTGIKGNFTNTASGANSLMIDLQVDSASKFNVSKAGTITLLDTYKISAGGGSFLISHTVGITGWLVVKNYSMQLEGANLGVQMGLVGAMDVAIMRNSAGVLEINNATLGTYRDLNLRNLTASGNVTVTGTINTNSGSAAAPAIALNSTANGLFYTGSSVVRVAAGGAEAASISLSAATFTGAISASNLSGTNTGDQTITLTGDVTGSGTGSFATTIANGVVTNAMLAGSIDLTTKVTGTLPVANGGTGATTAADARTNLGATTAGGNLFTLANPSAVTFLRVNADNTVSALDAATFRTAIGAGTSSTTGTVTSVSGTGTVSGLSLSGTVTSSGSLTLSGTLSVTASNFSSQTANTFLAAPNGTAGTPTFRALVAADVPTLNQNTTGTASNVTGTVAVANGGTGATSAANARTNLGATTAGGNIFTLANPSAITFLRVNADNTVSTLDAATFRTAIGAGTSSTTGTVTSVSGTGTVSGLSLSGTVTSSGSLTLGGTLAVTPSNFASQTANTVLAAPNGTAGTPTFRALVAADIPTLNQNTTGTAANVTGTVALANGGTGQTTAQAAINALAGATTSGQFLRGNGTNVTMSAIQAADVPTLNQNTTGTASNVTGTVAVANGGTGATTAANARTNLGATTVGGNLFTLTNPSAITFPRINADNTVSALDAATFRTAIGAGTSSTSGTVTSVSGTGTVSGLTLSGTVTSSGSLTLGGTLSVAASNFSSQTANTFLAAPNGTAGTPTFRAIAAADVPTLNQNTTGTAANVTGTVAVANGGTGATTLTGVLKGNGTSAFTAATAGTDFVAPGTATTFTATQTFNGSTSVLGAVLNDVAETVTVSATAATGTINYDVTTQSVLYYTTNASGNFTVNFRGSSGTSLNTLLATGQSMTVAFLVTNGGTAYYNNAVQVDGSSVTPKWQGGTAPSSGNASSIDVYSYTIIKTASATFTVLASQTKFA